MAPADQRLKKQHLWGQARLFRSVLLRAWVESFHKGLLILESYSKEKMLWLGLRGTN